MAPPDSPSCVLADSTLGRDELLYCGPCGNLWDSAIVCHADVRDPYNFIPTKFSPKMLITFSKDEVQYIRDKIYRAESWRWQAGNEDLPYLFTTRQITDSFYKLNAKRMNNERALLCLISNPGLLAELAVTDKNMKVGAYLFFGPEYLCMTHPIFLKHGSVCVFCTAQWASAPWFRITIWKKRRHKWTFFCELHRGGNWAL